MKGNIDKCNEQGQSRNRKGLSTVVGAVFMVIIIAGALNVTMWTMQQQDRVTQTVIEATNKKLSNLNEQIGISDIRINSNKFNLTVTNTGGASAHLKSVYIVNETASPKQQYRYDIDYYVSGRNYTKNIGQTLPLIANTNTAYSVKVISQAGNSAVARVARLGDTPLQMSLYVIPPTVTPGENVTLLYTVTNNYTDSNLAQSLTPTISTSCVGTGCSLTPKISPAGSTTLQKGATALLKWVYTANGPEGTVLMFNASLSGAKAGNYVLEKGRIQLIGESQTSIVSETTIYSSLVQKPEIFLIAPGPFGASSNKGLWGIVLANPTEQPMDVRKIVVTTFSPRGQSNDRIFDDSGGDVCAPTNITPASGAWSCPATNMLLWKISGTPLTIPAKSVQSFLATINPGSLASGGDDLESYAINVSVFTSMGQFGKSGYTGSMRNAGGAMANVYLSTTGNSTSTANMKGDMSNISEQSTITLYATIADLSTSGSDKIDQGTRLIIDIPKGFTQVQILQSGGFTTTKTQYSDSSWQIVGTLSESSGLDGVGSKVARSIKFSMKAPDVDDNKIYLLYILADGTSDNGQFIVGSIAESALQVVP